MKQKFYSQVNMERIFFFEWAYVLARPPTEERMRFGIIGAGRIGKIHGGNVAARPDSQVVLVADADPAAAAALAKATGAKVADSRRDPRRQGRRRGRHLLADRHPRRPHRARRPRRQGDLLREADRPRRRARPRLPRRRQADRRDADGRLQSPLRPEFRGAAPARRRRRDRRARDRLDHLARSRRRRRSPTSPARAASSAT